MNLKMDLSENNQLLLQEIWIKSENREYSKDEIRMFSNSIADYIFSKSSKNGDIAKATDKYRGLLDILVKNEK